MTPHLGASTEEAQENVGIEVAEAITDYLVNGAVRNAVNLPNLDAKTYAQVKPYLVLGEKIGPAGFAARAQAQRPHRCHLRRQGHRSAERSHHAFRAQGLFRIRRRQGRESSQCPRPGRFARITRRGNQIQRGNRFQRMAASVAVFNGDQKVSRWAARFYGAKSQPRIVRVNSQPVEIVPEGVLLFLTNKDRPGIVGYLGTLLGKHHVNIASMSLSRVTRRAAMR